MKSLAKIASPACVLFFAALCFSQSAPDPKSGPPAAVKSEAEMIPPAEQDALFPAVVATVNGKPVLGRDLEIAVRRELAAIGNPEWKNLREDYRGQLTQSKLFALVNTNLIYQKAIASGIKATDAEVKAELQNMSKSFKNDAEMDAWLAKQKLTRALFEKTLMQSMTVTKYVEENVDKKVTVSPEEMAKYIKDNPDEFRHPDIVRISQVVIPAGESGDAFAKIRAEALLARVEKGDDFAKLAKENSADASAAKGGDIGYQRKEDLVPEYAAAAFSLPIGGARMIKLKTDYIVFKVTGKKTEGTFALEDVQEKLATALQKQKSQVALTIMINQLRDQGEVDFLIRYGQSLEEP